MQILNYRGHWGCITTLGCSPGHVKVFDSMYTSPALVTQICVLLHTKESKLSIEMMNIQKQPNGSDCGLYVIANALAVCLGKNPCKIKWTNSLMRSHFRSCLENRKLTMFPAASEQRKVEDEVTKNYEFVLFGCWRKRMAQCRKCGEWFHHDCENIPETVACLFSKKKKLVWFCCSCS